MMKHSGSLSDTSLRDRVAEDLKETFRGELLEPGADEFTPDLTIKGRGRPCWLKSRWEIPGCRCRAAPARKCLYSNGKLARCLIRER